MAIWALAPNTNKPTVAKPGGDLRGGLIIKRDSDTSIVEVATLAINVAHFSKETTKSLQEQYNQALKKYWDLLNECNKDKEKIVQLELWVQQL